MQTSNFAKVKTGVIKYPVSISRFPPVWYNGAKFKQLAPKVDLLNAYKAGEVSDADYTTIYIATVLDKFDPVEIYERLTRYYTPDVTLLCYEPKGIFCHRRLVAAWLETANKVSIPEV